MNHNGQNYQYSKGNIICIFDGVRAIGFYDINDLGLERNLISNRTEEMDEVELACKAFLKDYFDRIIDSASYMRLKIDSVHRSTFNMSDEEKPLL